MEEVENCTCMIKQQPVSEKCEWNPADKEEKQMRNGKLTWYIVIKYAEVIRLH